MRFDVATAFPTFEPARRRAAAWWGMRSHREQALIAGLALLLIVWLTATMIVRPVLQARAQALNDIRTFEALGARLRVAGPLGATVVPTAMANASPAAILSATGAQFGIVAVVNPEADGVRVTVGEAPYESVIRWIAAFEQTGRLRVTRMRLDRRPVSGMVSAELAVRS